MKAIVLCGGKGLRLGEITQNIPKPLLYLKDKPLVKHITDFLYSKGFKNIILAIGYKGEMIKDYYSDKKDNLNLSFVDSGDANILCRIIDCAQDCNDEFLVVYGDTIANVNIDELIRSHRRSSALVTITTYPMQSPFGLVHSDDSGVVTEFKEKPFLDYWMNIGFMVVNKKALDYADEGDDILTFFQKLIKDKQLFEFRHKGKHITVNTEKEKQEAEKEIDNFYIC